MAQTHRPSGRIPDEHEDETEEQRRERARREEEEARAEAEARTAGLPRQGEAVKPPLTPAEAARPGEKTVKMNFPAGGVMLTLDDFRMVRFPEGVQEVPESLVDHAYLKDNGVTKV